MILNLSDISKLLYIVKSSDTQNPITHKYAKKIFNDSPIKQARFTNYEKTEKFCKDTNLIIITSNNIFLTNIGKKIMQYHDGKDIIDERFNKILINEGLFNSELGKKIQNALLKFDMDKNQNIWYPKTRIYYIFEIHEILPILYELKFLEKKDDIVVINPQYLQLITKGQKRITQKQLEIQLQNKKRIGDISEKIVLNSEKNRLGQEGNIKESKNVCLISKEFANAGYDIESFLKDDKKINKIYIEVKGSSEKKLDFYWSINELEKAKKYGDKYWIYFVPGVNVKTGRSPYEIIKLQNPYKTVFENSKFKKITEKYHITMADSHD